MKRTFTKYPSNYVKADYAIPSMGSADYPAFVLYDPKYATPTIFKYKQKYLHVPDTSNDNKEGVYYRVNEVSKDGGKTFRAITQDEINYLMFLSELDVCEDNEVGFIWNGYFNHLGHLDGNQVVKEGLRRN